MTSLVFVTQHLDRSDPNLGFVVRQMEVLAERVDRLVVIANSVRGPSDEFAFDVVTLGKEAGRSRIGRGARYVVEMARLVRTIKPTAIVAHMCPIYLNLAWPIARASGTPTLLWYVYTGTNPSLRLAGRLADVVVTALPGSCALDLPEDRLRVIGHAIETDVMTGPPLARDGDLRLLALGRTSRDKHYDCIIEAVRLARQQGAAVSLQIAGPSLTADERAVRGELETMMRASGLAGVVRIDGPIERGRVPSVLSGADVVVNAAEHGNADKVVFEAMACRRPVLVSTPVFDALLAGSPVPLRVPPGDPVALADRITELERLPSGTLAAVGSGLRDGVVEGHSLEHWASAIIDVAQQLGPRPHRVRIQRHRSSPFG